MLEYRSNHVLEYADGTAPIRYYELDRADLQGRSRSSSGDRGSMRRVQY